MRKMKTKTKFQIGSTAILVLTCIMAATIAYYYLMDMAKSDIYKETEIFIGTAEATRTYVKDVLRPEVSQLVADDGFIPHAMSTSFVGREIMARLQQRFPDFSYKRAARNPMNSINQADGFELSMLEWFSQHPEDREWHGLIEKDNRSYYTRFRAIRAEAECLRCHGDPIDAPESMKAIYGTDGGYHYRAGEVVAADTIYIPVDVTFDRIRETAWTVFILAGISLFTLLGLFYLLFNRTIVSEMKLLLERFRSIQDGPRSTSLESVPTGSGDEFEQLTGAFDTVASELKEAHEELKASETKYRLMFENSRDAILVFDKETRIKDINYAGIQLFGFKDKAEALAVETGYQLFWDTREAKSFFKTATQQGYVQGLEVPIVDRRGGKRIVLISATARLDESAQYAGLDAIFYDMTEKRRIEDAWAQTEKLASIGQLASGVAHEINNPLGVIKCYANLIAKGADDGKQVTNDIQIIQKHTEQCKSIVEALLNFARISEPRKTQTDIGSCIEEILSVLDPQIYKADIIVQKELTADIDHLTVDAQQIKQVLVNLLLNAIQAMPDGGRLHVRTRHRPESSTVAIEIEDTGTGIPDKYISRIFDPFFTTKEADQGTGLGLSVSYGIIKGHGGDIEVVSRKGRGSRFTILLPTDGDENGEAPS